MSTDYLITYKDDTWRGEMGRYDFNNTPLLLHGLVARTTDFRRLNLRYWLVGNCASTSTATAVRVSKPGSASLESRRGRSSGDQKGEETVWRRPELRQRLRLLL